MQLPTKFGPYLLLERVSVGGMAEVFKAKEYGVEGFARTVAVKRILPHVAEDEEFIAMFTDEAKIAVQLTHGNIAQIYSLGNEQDSFYIALEYVSGRDLRAIFTRCQERGEPMPVAQACYIIMKICEGVDYAHNKKDAYQRDLNIVHRDVSPPNILVSFEGEVKLIDFGVAKAAGRASRTQAGILKGKFGYMSPEQVRGMTLDRRSDVFSMGVVLFEILTGRRLFHADTDFSTLEMVRAVEVPRPSRLNPAIPANLERIVIKALAKEPAERYASAIEFHDDLQQFMFVQGLFYSRKDLAAWMHQTYFQEISLETERDKAQASLRPEHLEGGVMPPPAAEPPPPRGKRRTMMMPTGPGQSGSGVAPAPPPDAFSNPAGSGVAPTGSGVYPAGSGVYPAGSGAYPAGSAHPRGPVGSGVYPSGPAGSGAYPQGPPAPVPPIPAAAAYPPPGHRGGPRLPDPPPPRPVGPGGSSSALDAFGRGTSLDWDEDELETRLFDNDPLHAPGPPGMSGAPWDSGGGARVVPPFPVGSPPEDSPVRSSGVGWALAAGIGGLVVAAIVGVMWVRRSGTSTSTSSATAAASVAADGAAGADTPERATSLTLEITPADAMVRVDGRALPGPSPFVLTELSAGPHAIQIDKDGFLPLERQITVSSSPLALEFKLQHREVTLALDAVPPTSVVRLVSNGETKALGLGDGREYKLDREPGQSYELEVSRQGFETQTLPLEFTGEARQTVHVVLDRRGRRGGDGPGRSRGDGRRTEDDDDGRDRQELPRAGNPDAAGRTAVLRIGTNSGVGPAKVFIDGKPVGKTPRAHVPVRPGRHTIKYRWPDGREVVKTITVREGDVEIVKAG